MLKLPAEIKKINTQESRFKPEGKWIKAENAHPVIISSEKLEKRIYLKKSLK